MLREADYFWDDLGTKERWRNLFLLPLLPLAVMVGSLLMAAAFWEIVTCGEG